MTAPATLGRGLGRSLAFATVLGMIVFGVVVAIALYHHEITDTTPEDPPLEIIEEVAVGFAFAGPIGVALSLAIARKLTRGTTERLDGVIASASQMTGERLDQRLPVGPSGDALDRMSVALNAALDRIERGVAAQRQFAADASHELRTPLTVISTNLEVARRKPRDAGHWEHVADGTLAEVRRMNALVDKLLVLSRAGAAALHRERTDLRRLAALAVERATGGGQEARVVLRDGAPVSDEVDIEALHIVLDNLLRNAIDHSPPGEPVEVDIAPGPEIVVDDRGPGVPAELRERIFQPFSRGGGADRASHQGFGLGLAICRRIVAEHGGAIRVESRPGGGARFVVSLARA